MRAATLAAGLLAVAHVAWAGTGDPSEIAARAAALCESGNLEGAAGALTDLIAELEREIGANHSATQIVRLNLAHVERARGREQAAKALEKLPATSGDEKRIGSSLKRALRKLRVCATVRPAKTETLADVSSEDHLKVARTLVARGLYRQALDSAVSAHKTAGARMTPAARMRLQETLALIHLQLGDHKAALAAAKSAEKLAREQNAIELRITLARLVAQAGDLERARVMLDELDGAARSPREVAELEEARGDLALRLGAPRQALVHLELALDGHAEVFGSGDASTAAVHHLRGDAHRLAGDFPLATSGYREALRIRQRALGAKHPETARTRNAIGVLQADIGDWDGADDAFASAHSAMVSTLGADHAETITIGANRALARWGASEDPAAATAYGRSVDALGKALGADHPSVASAVRNLSRIEFDRGNAQRAEELLERALAAQQRSLGSSHPALAPTRLARGRLLAHRGELSAGAAEVDRAIKVLVAERGRDHPLVARARTRRARIAAAQQDRATALREAIEASRAITVHTGRTFGAISDRQRALIAQDAQHVIGALLSVPDAPAKDIFIALLPHRDSVLRSIAASHAATRAEGGGEFVEQLQSLRERYLAAVLSRGPGSAQRVKEVAAAIEGLEALAAAAGSHVSESNPDDVLTLACRRLPADAALVKFVAYEYTAPRSPLRTSPAHAALIVRGDGCRVKIVRLGSSDKIEAAAERFAQAMRAQRSDAEDERAELSRLLLEPLAPALSGANRWLVIPDGSLWGVPIGALPDPQTRDHYLFERVTIGYLTSTFELADASDAGEGEAIRDRALLIGAPEFGSGAKGGPVVLTDTGPCQLRAFEKLPGTRRELEDIGALLGKHALLVGSDATKRQLERELGRNPSLVHFATHAYFAGQGGCGARTGANGAGWREGNAPFVPNPLLLSGIVMAGANNPTRVDAGVHSGILTAYEVAGLDLSSANLVVLSACDTGTGLQLRGQEVQGLRWGFRAAGARALVTSLWRSNDAATRRLMNAFYEALLSGDLQRDAFLGAGAMRRAQLAQIESETRLGVRRPLIWANFIFSGVL